MKKFLIMIFIPSICYGYSFTQDFNEGFYWANFPINFERGVLVANQENELRDLTEAAEAEWESAAASDLWQFSSQIYLNSNLPGGRYNLIRWSDNFEAETGFDDEHTLAITIRYQSGPYIVNSEIILNGNMVSLKNNYFNNLNKTILHELGHTIGLDHSDEESIMAPYIGIIDYLTTDDIAAAIAVVNETKRRQSIGFVSDLLKGPESSSGSSFASCGTVDYSGNNRLSDNIISFLMPIMMMLVLVWIGKSLPQLKIAKRLV